MYGWFSGSLFLLAAVLVLLPVWLNRKRLGWQVTTYLSVMLLVAGVGAMLWIGNRDPKNFLNIPYVVGMLGLSLAGVAAFLGLLEFGVLRTIGSSQLKRSPS